MAAAAQQPGKSTPPASAPPLTLPSPSAPTGGGPGTPPPKPSPTTQRPSDFSPVGAIDLRPKFRSGQQIHYVFDQNAKSAIKSLDPNDTTLDQDQEQTERIGLTMKVVEAGDEGATIQVVYDSIRLTLKTPDGTAEYDSAKIKAPAKSPTDKAPASPAPAGSDPLKAIADLDMNGMLGLIVGPMVGSVVTVKTDRNGAISSVSGGDALGGSMAGLGLPGGGGLVPSPTQMANWLVAGVGGPGNGGLAHVGESWTDNDSLSGTPVGAFKMVTRHTLTSATAGTARVSFNGHIEPASAGAPPAPGASAGQVQSASYTGNYVWDTRGGSLSEMIANMSVSMDGGITGARARMSSDSRVQVRRVTGPLE
jgi:hypothetical protein